MPKLLAEFLQEQQEPFSLDLYLLQRGSCRGNGTVSLDCAQFLKGLRKRQCAVTNCSEFIKGMLGKKVLRRAGGRGEKMLSCTKIFKSCSERDDEDAQCQDASLASKEEAEADQRSKGQPSEEYDDDKQLSPVSVLEETKSDEGSPLHDSQNNFMVTHCEPHSTVQLELHSNISQYSINKRLLQQTKQLLIDCVREVIESHRRRDESRQQLKQILGAEELWKLVCENVWLWSCKDSSTNIVHLVHCDYMNSLEEWNADYQQKKEGIIVEIGDDILEGIIYEILVG